MASALLQAERFVKIINQQLEILKEERNTVIDAVDHRINQVKTEVNAWINFGNVNHTTYTEINNRIQETIGLFLEKSAELSGKQTYESKSDLNQTLLTNTNFFTSPRASSENDESKTEPLLGSCEEIYNLGCTHNMTMRFAILEEAVNTLKKTTENVQDHLGNVDKILKDVSTQPGIDHKKVENFRNGKINTEKKQKNKIMDLEKRYQEINSRVDDLFEAVTNVNVKLNRLEEENKYVNVSLNEFNKQISSVRTCSNDALMSIQDLSKSVESTNQHYNEMSNKMNQLEISFNLTSSQYTKQFENMSSLNKVKTDDVVTQIGLICQLLNKRLSPLEKLNETLNKKVSFCDKKLSEKDDIEKRVVEMSNKITELELKCILPKVGFFAFKRYQQEIAIRSYDHIDFNHGGHFNQSTGTFTAPLNGMYLITLMTVNPPNSKVIKMMYRRKLKDVLMKSEVLHRVSKNLTVIRFAEIAAGDQLYLEWEKIDDVELGCIILFACYLIQI